MQWEFRKTLESFQNYKKTSDYKNEIEKGDSNLLKMCLREIEMIISEPKEKITPKVLALRFVRDIMILGRADVIEGVQKLVPHILKICSFKLQTDDPNRGETFFHQHPSYLKTSKQQVRKQIGQLGSTYLILSLESILHWAKWIPFDENGNKSLYVKAYKDLIERGVSFPSSFHYYKQSDTEKFKSANKVESFTDSFTKSQEQIASPIQKKEKSQQINIGSFEQPQPNIKKVSSKPEPNAKIGKSPKKQVLKGTSTSQEFQKKQQKDPKSNIYELKLLIDEKQREIANLNQIHQKEKRQIIQDYERKMEFLKARANKDQNRPLIIQLQNQNDQLKKRLNILETQLSNSNTNSTKLQELQASNTKLEGQVSKLKIENQNLITTINEKKKNQQKTKLQIESQRKISMSKNGDFVRKIENLENQNMQLKLKLNEANKIIEAKNKEIFDLKEDQKRFLTKTKDQNEKKNIMWTQPQSVRSIRRGNHTSSEAISPQKQHHQQILVNKTIKYTNYEDLYLQLKPSNKQSFLRLFRSAFKKKDILFKQNQLQIGVITETLSDNKVLFLLHLTNLAETHIENIKIEPLMGQGFSLRYELNMQNIFCIQPQEQEKVECIVTNQESPFIKDRSVVAVSYEKNGEYFSHNIFLPFMIPKFLVNSQPLKTPTNPRCLKEELAFQYTKKMLPRPSYIKSYFENTFERIQNRKYEVELYHRETALSLHLTFLFQDNESLCIQSTLLREKMNEKQKHIMQEILGFLQVAFKK